MPTKAFISPRTVLGQGMRWVVAQHPIRKHLFPRRTCVHDHSKTQKPSPFSWPFLLCFGIPTYEITNRDTHARSTEYDLLLAEYLRRNYSANSYGGAGSVAVAACDSHVLFDAGRIRCSSQQQGMCGKPACTRGIRIWLRAPGHPLLKPER